jgi:hypothetical protein
MAVYDPIHGTQINTEDAALGSYQAAQLYRKLIEMQGMKNECITSMHICAKSHGTRVSTCRSGAQLKCAGKFCIRECR